MRNAEDSSLSLCGDEYYIIYMGGTLLDWDWETVSLSFILPHCFPSSFLHSNAQYIVGDLI